MHSRRERPGDASAIRAVLTAAFPTSAEADLVDALRGSSAAVVSVVATASSRVVGHALLSRLVAQFESLGLAPVAVAPAEQRRGIGSHLVRHALDLARGSGSAAAFVLGDPHFYVRFGFATDLASGFASPYAGPHFMALALGGTWPTRTGRVEYPPEFAALE